MDTWSTKEQLFWSCMRRKESADYQEKKAVVTQRREKVKGSFHDTLRVNETGA